MNDSFPPRMRVACLRALCIRLGALLTASVALVCVACASLPALAAARTHHPTHTRRTTRRHHAARLRVVRRQVAVAPTPGHDAPLADARHTRAFRRCADAHVRIGHTSRADTERATLCLLNRQRVRRGLPPLRLSRRLDHSAQSWTNIMVRDHSFSHGSDFGSRISAVGFNWSQIGENIADGFKTPAGAVRAWMASTGHCQNILNPDFREVGAGFARGTAIGGDARGTWTTDFGLLMNQRAPSGNWGPAEHCPY